MSLKPPLRNGEGKEVSADSVSALLEVRSTSSLKAKYREDREAFQALQVGNGHAQISLRPTDDERVAVSGINCDSLSKDIWALAFGDLKRSNPELILVFESSLALYDNHHVSGSNSTRMTDEDTAVRLPDRNTAKAALAKIETFQKSKIDAHGRSAQFRESFEGTVRLVLSAKDVISSAVSFNPIAASAWTCVSILLPMFLNSTIENQAALEGLNYITILLIEYRWKENVYLTADASEDFISTTRKLYSSILEYEALLYSHMQHKALSRFSRNLIHSGDWKTRLDGLKRLDSDCRRVTDSIREARTYDRLFEERHWQKEQLDQSRQKAELANLQKLYFNYEYDKGPKDMRVPGTCEWFLKHPEFLTWRNSQASGLLWLTADPGCGKSVLAKYLIDGRAEALSVNIENPILCYFFFKAGDEDRGNATRATCALLYQLFLQKPKLYKYAASDFEKKGDRFLTDLNALWRIFVAAINDEELSEVVCVLDGLDECESSSRNTLISLLVELHLGFYKMGDAGVTRKLLITSRPYLDIERGFRELTNTIPSIRLSGEKETQSIRYEINLVLDARVSELAETNRLSPQARDALHKRLSSIEHRTYLWLKLILEYLGEQNEVKARDVSRLVASIPANIEEAYDGILSRSNDPLRARQILHFILGAVKPLSLAEMNILVSIDDSCRTKDDIELSPNSTMESTVKNICGLFVTIIDSRIHLIHQTARDYLILLEKTNATVPSPVASSWKHTFAPQDSALLIAKSCILFLSLEDFDDVTLTAGNWRMRNIKEYALFNYAARYWPHHLADSGSHANTRALHRITSKLFRSKDDHRFSLWIGEYRKAADPYSYFPLDGSILMWTAYFGQDFVMAELLGAGHDPNAVDAVGRTALSFAAHRGHLEVVKMLLLKNVDADPKDILAQSPLVLSIQGQHLAVAKALLIASASTSSPDIFGRKPYSYCGSQMRESLREYFRTDESSEMDVQETTSPSKTFSSELEKLGADIRAYLMLRHETGQWQSIDQNNILINANGLPSSISQLYDALRVGIHDIDCDNDASYEEGRFRILSAFTYIRAVIAAESPLVLILAARIFTYAWHYRQRSLARAFLWQMSDKASNCYDKTYPLATILSRFNDLLLIGNMDAYQTVSFVLQTCFDTWTNLLGRQHIQVVYVRHIQLWVISVWKGPESVTDRLQELSVEADYTHGPESMQSLQILRDVAQNLLDRKDLTAAKEKACIVRNRAEALQLNIPNPRYAHLLCDGLRIQAEAQSDLKESEDAEKTYRLLLAKSEESWGPLHRRTKKYQKAFGLWLKANGRVEEATLYAA